MQNIRINHLIDNKTDLFGAGASRIADVLAIPKDVAQQVYNKLLENLPELTNYQEKIKKKAVRDQFVRDLTKYSRIKHFNWKVSKEKESYKVEKEGVNFPIQAGAASMLKEATIAVDKYFTDNNLDCQLKLSVHDELVCQIPKGREDIALNIQKIMQEVGTSYLVDLVMESSMEICDHWKK